LQDAERVKQSQEITQIIGDIDRRNEVFMNQNRDQGPYVLALYDVTLTFSDQAKVLLRNGEVHGASVYSDYSNKFLLFGERCVSGFKEIGVVARSGVKVVQRALLDSRDQGAHNFDQMMKDPIGYTSSIVRGIGEASNALSLGFARLMFDTKNFTQDAKKVLGALSERWNSLSSEEKLYHSVKTLCDFTLAGVTPVGIVGGGQALPSVENIKTLCAAIKNSDQVTTTLVSCSRPIADAFQKAGATATTVGQAVVDAVGVSFALVKEEKTVADKTLVVIKNNPQIVAQEGGIVNAVKKTASEIKNHGTLIGNGSILRKVGFFDGLQHAKIKHMLGDSKYSLKILDPSGNPDKWLQYIVELAQRGSSNAKNIPTGQIMEIMGSMPITNGPGNLNIGVRLFKPNGQDVWELSTILTKQ